MRQLVIAIVVGLGVGLGLFLAVSQREGSAPPGAPTAEAPTPAPDAPQQFDGLYVEPRQPGLIVDVRLRGAPVRGLAVQLFRDDFDLLRADRGWSKAGVEQTGDEGYVTFPAAAGHYLAIAATAEAQAALEFDVPRSSAPTRVTLALGALRTLEGLVRKQGTADPVPNARVRVDHGTRASVALATVTTDAFGRFAARVPEGTHYFLEASAQGYVTTREAVNLDEKIELELVPGVPVDGLVTSADGTPVPDVTVRAAPIDATTLSDREGRFTFTVAAGPTSLHALAIDGRQALARVTAPGRVTLRLGSGASLSGVVTGTGITAVDVRVLAEPDDLEVARILTGADGRFEAHGLPAGRYSVRAQQGAGRRGSAVGIELPGAPMVEVQLSDSARVTGLVVNGDGVPVDGATVTLSWPRGMKEIDRTARTAEDGRFDFDELLPAELSLRAHLGELVSSEVGVYVAPGVAAEQTLTLAQQGRLVGTVDPPTADTVWIRGAQFSEHVKVNAGRFELLLPPGHYRTFIAAAASEHMMIESDQLDVKGGELTTVTLSNRAGTDAGFKFAFGHPELGSGISFENSPGGVRVDFLMSDCPAARAGVAIGDLVVSIDGAPTKDALDAFARVRKPNGDQLALGVRREGRDLLLTVR